MFDLKNPVYWRRLIVMMCGVIIMGIGISLFRLSLMGNDPHSSMVLALGDHLGLSFSSMLIIINIIWFVLEITLRRDLIGIGTFFNWFGVGIFTDMWTEIISNFFTVPSDLAGRLIMMVLGLIISTFSCALYQTPDLGIAPYDAVSLILMEHLPIPYFGCRMITDSLCVAVGFLLGGIIGIGTLLSVLISGPFINFFTNTVARKLCGYDKL